MSELQSVPVHRARRQDVERELTLRLLLEIEQNELPSQRGFAGQLNVAVGLVNAYLKRCIRKGLVKISGIPARRYAYYLTPEGFSEKSRLVAEYLSSSLHLFREARGAYTQLLERIEGHTGPIVLVGSGELAEIALLSARELRLSISCVYEPGSNLETFLGLPVQTRLEDTADTFYVVADLRAPQDAFDRLAAAVDERRILAPRLLSIHRQAEGREP